MKPVHLDGLLALLGASGAGVVLCESDLGDEAAGVGAEEHTEGWLEVGFDGDAVGVGGHAELGEQGLVELSLEVVGGGGVGVASALGAVGGERDELVDLVEVGWEGVQPGGHLGQLAG